MNEEREFEIEKIENTNDKEALIAMAVIAGVSALGIALPILNATNPDMQLIESLKQLDIFGNKTGFEWVINGIGAISATNFVIAARAVLKELLKKVKIIKDEKLLCFDEMGMER